MTRASVPSDDVASDGAGTDATREFEEFYAASFTPLCAQLFAHTGQLVEAQDVVQEAFIRAYARWSNLRTYDDPVAWVRKVAWNLAISRWRRLRRHVPWHADAEGQVPPLSTDHLALRAALAELPQRQRQAVVLHYLADLPISEVARITGAAEGTVKSWLHRARTTLAATLTDVDTTVEAGRDAVALPQAGGLPSAVAAHVTPPGADRAARTVRRRRAARTTVAGAVVLAILLTGAVLLPRGDRPDPAVTTPPPTQTTPSRTPLPTTTTASPTESGATPTGDGGQTGGTGSGGNQGGSGGFCPTTTVDVVTEGNQPGWYTATFAPDEFYEEACQSASIQVMWVTYTRDGAGNMVYTAGDARRLSAASPSWTFESFRLLSGCFHFYVVVGDVTVRNFIPADQVGTDQWRDPLYATADRRYWGWSSDCAIPPSSTIGPPPG